MNNEFKKLQPPGAYLIEVGPVPFEQLDLLGQLVQACVVCPLSEGLYSTDGSLIAKCSSLDTTPSGGTKIQATLIAGPGSDGHGPKIADSARCGIVQEGVITEG